MASSLLISPHEMASLVVLNVQKPSGFGGLRPLDPHRGVAPGPHQGPLKQAPESPAVRHDSSARCTLQVSLFPVFKMLAGMLQGISPN